MASALYGLSEMGMKYIVAYAGRERDDGLTTSYPHFVFFVTKLDMAFALIGLPSKPGQVYDGNDVRPSPSGYVSLFLVMLQFVYRNVWCLGNTSDAIEMRLLDSC